MSLEPTHNSDSFSGTTPGATLPKNVLIDRMIYPGVVVNYSPETNQCLVEMTDTGMVVNTTWIAGGIAHNMLGIRVQSPPAAGAEVLVLYMKNGSSYTISTTPDMSRWLPQGNADNVHDERAYDDTDYSSLKKNLAAGFGALNHPILNLMEGEIDMTFANNVGLSLLRNIARLSGGLRAFIECCVLNDMVRIVSGKFAHHSVMSDTSIYRDGNTLNHEHHFTDKGHEADNLESPTGEPRAVETTRDEVDTRPEDSDPFQETARWRASLYTGHLGGLLNMFFYDPVQELAKIGSQAFASGRLRTHVDKDGSFLLQTRGDLIFERVTAIPVPRRDHLPDDAQGDRLDNEEPEFNDENNPLREWVVTDGTTLFEVGYKLRDYARWYANWYSLAQFHRQDTDFTVPSEDETPGLQTGAGDQDRLKSGVNKESVRDAYRYAYSTIRMFRDGSIVIQDTHGSTFHTWDGNVSISSAKSTFIEAGKDVNIVAGRNLNMKAGNHIELTGLAGLLLRGKKYLQAVCDQGTLLLESLADPGEHSGNDRLVGDSGITIKTGSSSIDVQSQSGKLRFFSGSGRILFRAVGFVARVTGGILRFFSGEADQGVDLANGEVKARRIYSESLVSRRISNERISRRTAGDPPDSDGHASHVIGLDEDNENLHRFSDLPGLNPNDQEFLDQTRTNNAHFSYLPSYFSNPETDYYQTLTQQALEHESFEHNSGLTLTDWDFSDDDPLIGGLGDHRYPYPGAGVNPKTYTPEGAALDTPTADKVFSPVSPPMVTRKTKFKKQD